MGAEINGIIRFPLNPSIPHNVMNMDRPSSDNLLPWGLIGAGDIVRRRVAPALKALENCELVSVSRGQAELAESFAAEFGIRKWFADWRELLADGEIDAVYIATPVYLHAEQTIAAAEAGKHVLCEKPMALNVADCDRMIAACRANNVRLGIAYYRRFYPVLARVREIIGNGIIGKPVFAQINAFEFIPPTDEATQSWFFNKQKGGGGPMIDFGCHRLELLTHLFGKATAVESIVTNVAFDREVEDTAAALLKFESGTCASVIVTHAVREAQDTLDIFGTAGSIHIPVLNAGQLRLVNIEGESTEIHSAAANTHQPLIDEFSESVLSGRDPAVGGLTGRAIAELIDRIYGN
ncbi:MAG: Gfo/Idh/MocA family oxidoreductase [Acidobacteriota bacterium]